MASRSSGLALTDRLKGNSKVNSVRLLSELTKVPELVPEGGNAAHFVASSAA